MRKKMIFVVMSFVTIVGCEEKNSKDYGEKNDGKIVTDTAYGFNSLVISPNVIEVYQDKLLSFDFSFRGKIGDSIVWDWTPFNTFPKRKDDSLVVLLDYDFNKILKQIKKNIVIVENEKGEKNIFCNSKYYRYCGSKDLTGHYYLKDRKVILRDTSVVFIGSEILQYQYFLVSNMDKKIRFHYLNGQSTNPRVFTSNWVQIKGKVPLCDRPLPK